MFVDVCHANSMSGASVELGHLLRSTASRLLIKSVLIECDGYATESFLTEAVRTDKAYESER